MDRKTIYFGQIPLETDLLGAQQNAMVALAKLAAGVLGQTTIVNGFTCTPTTPASLSVLLTAGEIYQLENLEQTTWSSLSANTANSILKQGIQLNPLQFGITPPGTVGFSQIFLVEVQYQDLDTGLVVLPYFNSVTPSVPFLGPGNSGTAQNTVRQGIVASQVKAGIAATTGTQQFPLADPGWTPLFYVTVANGAATITSGNIVQALQAPFIPVTLPNVPAGVQANLWSYAVDTGTPNNLVITPTPQPPAYTAGMGFWVKAANAPTGPCVMNVNGFVGGLGALLGNVGIVNPDGSAIVANQWAAGAILGLVYDGAHFQLTSKSYNDLIDSAVTFTVHGGGANFADLNAAYEYLSKFKITHNGSVTLQLAAGAFTYTSNVLIDHPNNNRIKVLGATMLAALPVTDASYAINGSASGTRATDTATNLAMLRTKFATELHFTGATSITIIGTSPLAFDALLITGDGSATSGINIQCNGAMGGTNGLATVGFGTDGITMIDAHVTCNFGIPVVSLGNGGRGISLYTTTWSSNHVLCFANASDGISIGASTLQVDGNFYLDCNAGNGLIATIGQGILSASGATSAAVRKNALWGFTAALSRLTCGLAFDFGTGATANGSGPLTVNDMSMVNVGASTPIGLSGSSPAVGTVGNNNSLISTT